MAVLFRLHAVVLAASLSAASLAPSCVTGRPITPAPVPVPTPVVCASAPAIPSSSRTTTLKTASGFYLTAEGGGCGAITATRKDAGPWETFAIEPMDDGDLALRTADGHYLSAELGGGSTISATRTTRGIWETWHPVQTDAGWALQAADGKHYLRAELGGGGAVNAAGSDASLWQTFLSSASLKAPPAASIAGRVRVASGRFVNDAGPFQWRGISEFDFVHLVRTGNEAEVQRRLARDISIGRRTVFRVFARAINLFDLNHTQPGYWDALDRTIALVNGAGAYVELVYLPDAQSLDGATRRMLVQQYGASYRDNPGVITQITNEPWQNGWSSAVDPALLELGDLLASVLGHRDFSIGDPADGDDADASAETLKEAVTISKHSNIIVIHSSRKGGAQPEAERYRRYIDHGESFYDVMTAVHQVNGSAACVNDEPMGFASQRWVPIPGGKTYEREFEPEAVLADELTALTIGCGHTAHYISAQDDAKPEFWQKLGSIPIRLPADASWGYRNDSWQGSATRGFMGYGKCRTYTNGAEAYVTCNGTNKGGVTWANGFAPNETVFDGAHLTTWHAQH